MGAARAAKRGASRLPGSRAVQQNQHQRPAPAAAWRTLAPICASVKARLTAVVDLPTPAEGVQDAADDGARGSRVDGRRATCPRRPTAPPHPQRATPAAGRRRRRCRLSELPPPRGAAPQGASCRPLRRKVPPPRDAPPLQEDTAMTCDTLRSPLGRLSSGSSGCGGRASILSASDLTHGSVSTLARAWRSAEGQASGRGRAARGGPAAAAHRRPEVHAHSVSSEQQQQRPESRYCIELPGSAGRSPRAQSRP